MPKIPLFAFATAAALLLTVGCGGGSSGGKDMAGAPVGNFASCVPAPGSTTATICFAFPLPDGGSAATICGADTENAWTWMSASSCALPGLVGCCGMNNNWQCFYGSGAAGAE
jgi:hypothetical protein